MWRLFALVFFIHMLQCKGSDALYDPPGGKGFWAHKITPGSTAYDFYRVTAMYVGGSQNTSVYLDTAPRPAGAPDVQQSSIDQLITVFENAILPVEHTWYTTPVDVNQDGKVILLLLDIQDGYTPGSASGYVGGYFYGINQYSDSSVNAYNSNYHSNYAEMLYLDTYPSDITSTPFDATAAHEYQHLLQFSKSYREGIALEPAWVDEGLAEITSDLTGFGPQTTRASYFSYSLTNSTSLVNFQSVNGSSLLDNYSMVYMYFKYLADVYGQGGISTIFNESRLGYDGVNQALAVLDPTLTGLANCGTTTGLTYTFFQCSYRYFWGALVNQAIGDVVTGVQVRYNIATDFSQLTTSSLYPYRFRTDNATFANALQTARSSGSYTLSLSTSALGSFSARLFQNAAANLAPTQFTACTLCALTMVIGNKYTAVFNHDYDPVATHGANVFDTRLLSSINADSTVLIDPIPITTSGVLQPLHVRFEISPPFHDHLRKHAENDRKKMRLK